MRKIKICQLWMRKAFQGVSGRLLWKGDMWSKTWMRSHSPIGPSLCASPEWLGPTSPPTSLFVHLLSDSLSCRYHCLICYLCLLSQPPQGRLDSCIASSKISLAGGQQLGARLNQPLSLERDEESSLHQCHQFQKGKRHPAIGEGSGFPRGCHKSQ